MPHVRVLRFFNWIEIDINDLVQVSRHNSSNISKSLEIKGPLLNIHKFRKRNWRKITNSDFIFGRIFNNLCAKIRRFDGSKILLIRFSITGILQNRKSQHLCKACKECPFQSVSPKSCSKLLGRAFACDICYASRNPRIARRTFHPKLLEVQGIHLGTLSSKPQRNLISILTGKNGKFWRTLFMKRSGKEAKKRNETIPNINLGSSWTSVETCNPQAFFQSSSFEVHSSNSIF